IGLAGALRLSGDEALRERVVALCRDAGLPVNVKGVSVDDVMACIKLDKKRKHDAVPFVLVGAPGDVTPGHAVADADIRLAVKELVT
ncbi:MAG: 3-dehydroquinate synthase, partial [Thermoleophilia bacterium]|nr:3-dehydroquinate synthase [Thermoleophilia bacterium]